LSFSLPPFFRTSPELLLCRSISQSKCKSPRVDPPSGLLGCIVPTSCFSPHPPFSATTPARASKPHSFVSQKPLSIVTFSQFPIPTIGFVSSFPVVEYALQTFLSVFFLFYRKKFTSPFFKKLPLFPPVRFFGFLFFLSPSPSVLFPAVVPASYHIVELRTKLMPAASPEPKPFSSSSLVFFNKEENRGGGKNGLFPLSCLVSGAPFRSRLTKL